MQTKLLICLSLLSAGQALGQHEMKLGQQVPSLRFDPVLNYPLTSLELSDLKGKLVIVDFWFTSCTSCIQSFPKLDSLQRKFAGDLQILLINEYESREKVQLFFKTWKERHGSALKLPSTLNTEYLKTLFPHRTSPHCIWIDQEGNLMGITESHQVTEKNILSAVKKEKVHLIQKRDQMDFDPQKPLFVQGNGGDGSDIKYRSFLSAGINGLGTYQLKTTAGPFISRWGLTNTDIRTLYIYAFQFDKYGLSRNRILLEVDNPSSLVFKGDTEDQQNKLYCYEIMTNEISQDSLWRLVQKDLNRYFGYTAGVHKRPVNCLIVTKVPNAKSHRQMGVPQMNISEDGKEKQFAFNKPLSAIIELLNTVLKYPVIDRTGLDENVDIIFPNDLSNIAALKKAFNKYGFELREQRQEMDMFVISEK